MLDTQLDLSTSVRAKLLLLSSGWFNWYNLHLNASSPVTG